MGYRGNLPLTFQYKLPLVFTIQLFTNGSILLLVSITQGG